MGLGMWGQLEMSCTFSALQLQRLVARMSWHAAAFFIGKDYVMGSGLQKETISLSHLEIVTF
ncbi:MAG: hypothetical protein GY906_26560, partial [bacterium]|nr:hypothetical protein [bacterium]